MAVRSAFISYAEEDAGTAFSLCKAAEQSGIQCWVAPRDIGAGDCWPEAIERALQNAGTLVVLLSVHSLKSPQVQREVSQAITYQKPIIPYRLDRAPITGSFAYLLATVHWMEGSRTDFTLVIRKMRGALAEGKPPLILGNKRSQVVNSSTPRLNNLDELTRTPSRFSLKNLIGKIFDDR